jgi:hypothetical protein
MNVRRLANNPIDFYLSRRMPVSCAIFYRTALEREWDRDEQTLFESLLVRNEQIDDLFRTFSDRRLALQGCDGEPRIEPSAAHLEAVEENRREIDTLEKRLKLLVTLIADRDFLLEAALHGEQTALGHERELYETDDPAEVKAGRPMRELREANIQELEEFHARRRAMQVDPFCFRIPS